MLSEYYNRNLYLAPEDVEHSVKPTVNFIKDFIQYCDPDTPPSNKLIEFEAVNKLELDKINTIFDNFDMVIREYELGKIMHVQGWGLFKISLSNEE